MPAQTIAAPVPSPARRPGHLARTAAAARRWLRSIPATVTVVAVMLAAGALSGTLYSQSAINSPLLRSLTFGPAALSHHRSSFATGALIEPSPALYAIGAILVLLALGFFERRVGARRAVIVLVGGQLVAGVGAAVLATAISVFPSDWANGLLTQADLGLSPGLFAVVGAGTAVMAADTRRAIRWAVGLYLLAMVAQSGLLWDIEHLLGWFAGLAAGPLAAGRHRIPLERGLPPMRRIRSGVALLLVVIPVAKFSALVVYPGYSGIFGPDVVGTHLHEPRAAVNVMIPIAVAVLIANALRRGLPVAWWASGAFTGIAVVHALAGPGSPRMADLICWAVPAAALIVFRSAWPWRLPTGTVRRLLPRLLIAVAAFVGLSSLLFWLLGDQVAQGVHAGQRAKQILDRATFADPSSVAYTKGATTAFTLTSWVWGLALLFLLVPVLYAHHDARRWVGRGVGRADADRTDLQTLLHQHGGGSIGWQRTWPGFTTWTTADGRVAISYRAVSGVAIALGDPVGPRERWGQASREFRLFCLRAGWTPAWYAVTDSFRSEVGHDGWITTQIGEDAIVDLPGLAFRGKVWQDVRTARNNAVKAGIRLEAVSLGTIDADLRARIDEVSRGWVSGKALPEMGFTLGTLDHAADPAMRTHIAIDQAGVVHGLTTWLPVHQDGRVIGWTLDVMRRRADGFRPVMEFLIAESALRFQAEGFATMSLSVAPLARRTAAGTRLPLDRTLDRMSALLEPAYGFRTLLAFKAKFHPRFAPVYLGYASDLDLTEISLAIGKAYLPHLTARQAITVARRLLHRSH